MWISHCPLVDTEKMKGVGTPNEEQQGCHPPPIVIENFRERWAQQRQQ